MFEDDDTEQEASRPPVYISGRVVVFLMFAFGIATTGTMWIYWKLHVGPFLPLQRAIAAEFEDSAPLVEGGQRKKHQNTPRILRVVLKVDFNPETEEARSTEVVARVTELAKQHQDLNSYDEVEIFLVQQLAEEEHIERRFAQPVSDL